MLRIVFLKAHFYNESESESRSALSHSLPPHGLHSPWNYPGQNTGGGSLSLLQRIFPTQGLKQGLPYCRRILYQLSYEGSPNFYNKCVKLIEDIDDWIQGPLGGFNNKFKLRLQQYRFGRNSGHQNKPSSLIFTCNFMPSIVIIVLECTTLLLVVHQTYSVYIKCSILYIIFTVFNTSM